MQRRRLLKLGLVSGAVVAVAGGVSLWWHEAKPQNPSLTPAAIGVLAVVSFGLLDGSMPSDAQARSVSATAYRDRLAATVSGLPPATRGELAQLLSLLALAPGRRILSGLSADWSQASPEDIRAALETMRASRLTLRRQVYHALRDLARAAWFADSSTWVALDYPGPQPIP